MIEFLLICGCFLVGTSLVALADHYRRYRDSLGIPPAADDVWVSWRGPELRIIGLSPDGTVVARHVYENKIIVEPAAQWAARVRSNWYWLSEDQWN